MMSRGFVYALGTGARKSLVLLWTAVLLCSLLLQYVAIATPAEVLANASGDKTLGGFEIDGNLYSGNASPAGDDWAQGASQTGLLTAPTIIDPIGNADTTNFSGGSKEDDAPSTWTGAVGTAAPKDDMGNVYVKSRLVSGDLWGYLGVERASNSGTTFFDFEFDQKPNVINPKGISVPNRMVGDVLVVAQQQGSGSFSVSATIQKWTGSAWGAPATPTAGQFYGLTNDDSIPVGPWTDAVASGGLIGARQFGEMAFDLTSLGVVLSCPSEGFGELNVRTRSAISASAEIKDYASAPIDIPSTCGELSWQKQDGAGQPLGGAVFTLTPNPWTGTGSVDIADLTSGSPASTHVDQDNRPGFFRLIDVGPDTYSIHEKTAPAGYLLDPTVKTTTVSEYEHATFGYVWADPAQVPPTIVTTSSASTADFGVKVHDDATLTGTAAFGPASGTVVFHLCGPTVAAASCATGGTNVGSTPVTTSASGGTATSPDYTVGVTAAASGYYCWRANYVPDANSLYLAGSHTNATTECFYVAPATINIVKTANPAGPVSAGDPVGFDITVSNQGTQTTLGVHVTDALPAIVSGWAFDAPTGTDTAGITCGIAAGTLTCDKATLAAGKSFTVHIHGTSSTASCPSVSNSAHVGTSNDGSDTSSDAVTVNCPDVKVTKTPDGGTIDAGDTATFSIKVENIGLGTAKAVTLHDALPGTAAVHWTTADAGCAISGADGAQVLDCTVGNLAPTAFKTYTVSANLAGTPFCAALNNSATATATNEASGDLANNTDAGSITVQCASIDITKVADKASVSAGDPIGFVVTVTSGGPGEAKGVTVTDTLPTDAGTTWSIDAANSDAGWTISGGVLSYGGAGTTLASGASVKVHITSPTTKATVADSPVVNSAHVSTSNDGSDDATDQVVVLPPDLQVVKTADNSPISAGDKAAYTITVTNIGDGIARGATLTDTLPAGIEWTTDTDGCKVDTGVLTCSFGDLDPDAVRVVNVSGETDAQDCHELPNTATVAATNEPGDLLANNTSSASITVNCPAIVITKTPVDPEVNATDQIGFDVVVTNTGAGTAFAVTVNDTLPTTAGLAWTIDGANSDAGWTIANGVLKFGPASLLAGTSTKVRIVSPTTPATCPSVHNQAFLTYTGGSGDDDGDIAVDCPDIQVIKTADKSPISAGETAAFTITVENIGEGTAYGVTLNDVLPAGVTWTTANPDCEITAGTLSCDFGDLAPADPQVVHVSGPTSPTACTPLVNTATASSTNEPSTLLANNTDGDTVDINCPDISLTKVAVDPSVNATDGVAFDIVLTNNGDGAAFNVAVNDPLPATPGTAWSIDAANSDTGWSIDGGVLKYTAAGFAAKGTVKVRIVSDTTAASCGDIDNTATVTYDGGETDASDTITVSCPDVVISKVADNSPILAGQTASFTISAWNEGPGTAYGVEITDTLPTGVAWQSDNEACSITSGVLTCDVGTLTAQDAPFTVTISGPTDEADCGTIPNEATVSATNEPSGALENDTDGDQIDVQCASITLVKTAGAAANGAILTIPVPGNVTFTYVVTNTGTADLKDLALVDDNATPANTADDITIVCPATTLAAGAHMTCTASIPVIGTGISRKNIATVTGHPVLDVESTVTATDDAVVNVPAPVVTPRPTPRITPPPTSTIDEGTQSSGGTGLLLVLLGIAGLMLVMGYVMPAPAKARSRRRNRRG